MSTKSKAFKAAAEKIDADRIYRPIEAAKLAKETSSKNFDATVDVAVRLGVDPARLTSWSAAPSPCPTAPVRTSASSSSPRARTPPPPKRPALRLSVPPS